MTDKKPHLFKPPQRGTQTTVKNGRNGWQVNTYNGHSWRCRDVLSHENLFQVMYEERNRLN